MRVSAKAAAAAGNVNMSEVSLPFDCADVTFTRPPFSSSKPVRELPDMMFASEGGSLKADVVREVA